MPFTLACSLKSGEDRHETGQGRTRRARHSWPHTLTTSRRQGHRASRDSTLVSGCCSPHVVRRPPSASGRRARLHVARASATHEWARGGRPHRAAATWPHMGASARTPPAPASRLPLTPPPAARGTPLWPRGRPHRPYAHRPRPSRPPVSSAGEALRPRLRHPLDRARRERAARAHRGQRPTRGGVRLRRVPNVVAAAHLHPAPPRAAA